MIRFIGIDPGDVWCGYAMLEYDPIFDNVDRYFLTESRVFHVPSREHLIEVVQDITFGLPAIVVAENYQVRPVGYNRFSKGRTLRLLGALELATQQSLRSTWNLVPPGNWEKDLPKLSGGMMPRWTADWQLYKKRRRDWGHAQSAWRVLFMYLLKHYPMVAEALRHKETVAEYKRIRSVFFSSERRTHAKDLHASAAKWYIHRPLVKSLNRLTMGAVPSPVPPVRR